jgi:hypothetical protein
MDEAKAKKTAEQLAWFAKQCQGSASHNEVVLVTRIKKELIAAYWEGYTDHKKGKDT